MSYPLRVNIQLICFMHGSSLKIFHIIDCFISRNRFKSEIWTYQAHLQYLAFLRFHPGWIWQLSTWTISVAALSWHQPRTLSWPITFQTLPFVCFTTQPWLDHRGSSTRRRSSRGSTNRAKCRPPFTTYPPTRWIRSWSCQKFSTTAWFSTGVNFTNILRKAFTLKDPKSVKHIDNLTVFFTLFGSAHVKTVLRTLMKLSPGLCQTWSK